MLRLIAANVGGVGGNVFIAEVRDGKTRSGSGRWPWKQCMNTPKSSKIATRYWLCVDV
jgi:hypothetical protein